MDNFSERWLPIPDWEGYYEASDLGRVRSMNRTVRKGRATITLRSRILSACPDGHGYLQVNLLRNGKAIKRGVHVLVMAAFVGTRPHGMDIRHGPNGKLDNSLANLSYGTRVENAQDKRRDGTHVEGTRSPQAKLTDAIVRECRVRYAIGDVSMQALAGEFQVSYSAMRQVLCRTRWKHVA